jgi:DNA polymerase-1
MSSFPDEKSDSGKGNGDPYLLTRSVAYNAAAELGVHCVLGWNMPMRVLDLWAEFRRLRNHCGKQEEQVPHGLDDALAFYDLDPLDTVEKNWMHDRVLTGGPWSDSDRIRILAACEADVVALANLFKAMFAELDFSKAAIRGRFMATAAQIENLGIPVNATLYQRVMHHRSALRRRLIDTCPVPVYENYTLDKDLTAKWIDSLGLRSWPRTAKTRAYMLDKETLKMMGRLCPEVEEFRQLKKSLSTLQDQKKGLLPIGADNRNRFSIRPFMAKTGRNLPLAHTFIFAQAAWFRNLIVAPPGYGLIYADWRQQEFFLAGYLPIGRRADAGRLQDRRPLHGGGNPMGISTPRCV